MHLITVGGTIPTGSGQRYPACIAGKRSCPPEDCGGPYGYAHLLEARNDPAHPDHAEMSTWVAEDFDPDGFSVAEADASVAAHWHTAPAKR